MKIVKNIQRCRAVREATELIETSFDYVREMANVKLFMKLNKITNKVSPKSWGWAFELKYDSLPRLGFFNKKKTNAT